MERAKVRAALLRSDQLLGDTPRVQALSGHPVDPAKVRLPPYYPDHPAVRLDYASYLDDAQHLDVNAGKVLKRLHEEGLAEDTIVFFFGDHGQPMPRGKQFLYDAGIRIPLIIQIPQKYAPQGYTSGSIDSDLVSSIDITATTLMLAGIDVPKYMEGRTIFGPKQENGIHSQRPRSLRRNRRQDSLRSGPALQIHSQLYPDRPYAQPNVYKDVQYSTLGHAGPACRGQAERPDKAIHGLYTAFRGVVRPGNRSPTKSTILP